MDSVQIVTESLARSAAWIEYLPLVIAALAVFFGPIMSYLVAKVAVRSQLTIAERNIRAGVLSRNRQEWIDTLRETVSEFVASLSVASEAPLHPDKNTEKSERVFVLHMKLSLLLNPREDDHRELQGLLDDAMDYLMRRSKKQKPRRKYSEIRKEITDLTQLILKREWERVKKLD